MADKAYLGHKIRRLRAEQGLTQTSAAKALGISASYLNLIEHNQRPLTLPLLLKLGRAFDVDLQTFSEDEDARVISELREVFADHLFDSFGIPVEDIDAVVASAPALAPAIQALYRSVVESRNSVTTLVEQLSDDASRGQLAFDLRTLLTNVRSFSEILLNHEDLEQTERQHFISILVRESERLGERMADLFDASPWSEGNPLSSTIQSRTDVADFFQAQGNYLDDLEQAAGTLHAEGIQSANNALDILTRHLLIRHGIHVKMTDQPDRVSVDLEQSSLSLSAHISQNEAAFLCAKEIAYLDLDEILKSFLPDGNHPGERAELVEALTDYFACAVLMPYDAFLDTAHRYAYDIDVLKNIYGTTFTQCCLRLASLRRPNASGIPFHLIQVDIAGNVLRRMAGSGLRIPRLGSPCPRWNVHRAFLNPEQINTQLDETVHEGRYFSIACATSTPGANYGSPRAWSATAIGCDVSYASRTIYANDLDFDVKTPIPVGSTCRTCSRYDCQDRAYPNIYPTDLLNARPSD